MAEKAGKGARIGHVFVLMLENRSFDHMLGFSGISGTDAVSGRPTRINALEQPHANVFDGQYYWTEQGADYVMPNYPAIELPDVVEQLCGVTYPGPKAAFPPITNGGFVASYAKQWGTRNRAEIMKCFAPNQVPVLSALAQEFVVCDNWFSSMPGPTWPNRFFAHAASSGGLDYSPIGVPGWTITYKFNNGTIFDRLKENNLTWRIYSDDEFAISASLSGINPLFDVRRYADFAKDVHTAGYPAAYTFIEPRYDAPFFILSNAQHPVGNVALGEALIKSTYEAIRNSPLWQESILIITWDEHGGFFDHVPPPPSPPGETDPVHSHFGFGFRQYGVRVPAIVISPLIPGNLIDHRLYEHASIPAIIEACFNLKAMTLRDAQANKLLNLLSLSTPRGDAPPVLPEPLKSNPPESVQAADTAKERASDPIDGEVACFVRLALRYHLALSRPEEHEAIMARVKALNTRGNAGSYMDEVRQKVRATRQQSAVAL